VRHGQNRITKDGLEKLKEELVSLGESDRTRHPGDRGGQRHGDLSENADITQRQKGNLHDDGSMNSVIIGSSEVIASMPPVRPVVFGRTVKLGMSATEQESVQLLGPYESDLTRGSP